jgi:hypothetical protein
VLKCESMPMDEQSANLEERWAVYSLSVWGTGLSGGAPDSVRWCTGQCPVRQAASVELAALGN